MGSTLFLFLFLLLLIITCDAQQSVTITISDTIINRTDERFVSFTIPIAQMVSKNPIDLTNPQLIYLTKQYAPSIVRIAGAQADYTYFEVGNENPCHLPSNEYHCFSMKQFDGVISFAHKISTDLIFGLGMGYPQYPPDGSTQPWNYSNTQDLLNYAINIKNYTNHDIYGFELGNEVNQGKPYNDATVQSNAFIKLRQIIDSMNPNNPNNKFKLFGPDCHSGTLRETNKDFDYYPEFVNEACHVIDGVTYHSYININQSALLTADGLNEQYRESSRISNIFSNKSICPSNPELIDHIFAGEIAEHNNGGTDGITNTYYDGFWYLDALGTLSNLGHAIFIRQTFVHATYGLLDENFNPNCDYYTGLLFNNLMLNQVLSIKSNEENFRIYAHCAKSFDNNISLKNGVSMAYINLFKQNVDISYDKNVIGLSNIYLWILTPNDTSKGLQSATMALNGKELKLNNGQIPHLSGQKIGNGETITIPKESYGFIVFTQTTITSCS